MALSVAYLVKTQNEAVVKVYGTNDNVTITLASLCTTDQIVDNNVNGVLPLAVDIAAVTWTGKNDNEITVTRNSVRIFTLPSTGSNFVNFNGQDMPAENTQNSKDIVVAMNSTGEVWMRLRKVSGFRSAIETGMFSVYDNPATIQDPGYTAP